MGHLKRGPGGHLVHGPNGHLVSCGCYSLTECGTMTVIYSRSDLSDYVGRVIKRTEDGRYYTVATSETCTAPVAVTAAEDRDECPPTDTTNCGTSCDHTVFYAVVAGISNGSLSNVCDCLNGAYDNTITFPMAYRGRFLWSTDPCCAAYDDFVGRRYCAFDGSKRCTDGNIDTVGGTAGIYFLEGSVSGAIDVAALIETGAGAYRFRFFRKTIAADTICDAIDYVRTTGISFGGADEVCPSPAYDLCNYGSPGAPDLCVTTSATVYFGP